MITDKMTAAFQKSSGGLFAEVEKADVGDSYRQLQKQGVRLLGWADPFMPDEAMPAHVRSALLKAISSPAATHYTAPVGNGELKIALAEKLLRVNHLKVDPFRNILITPGSDSGLYYAILPFINPGDEVLIPSPSYPNNFTDIEMMSGKVVPIELKAENGYQLDIREFKKKLSPRTKMVLLTHPNNPTTTIYNKQSLSDLRDFVVENDLVLVVDQAFEDFCYARELITPASLPGLFERTVSVFSFSKGMGLSGLRIAYLVAPDTIMDKLYANAVAVIGATSTSAQLAAIAALKDPSFMEVFASAFAYRAKKAYEIFSTVPKVKLLQPESGFLCWLDVSQLADSSEMVSYLLREAKVSVNDGKNYGLGGEGHLRIVLGVYRDDEKLIGILEDIKKALCAYPSK